MKMIYQRMVLSAGLIFVTGVFGCNQALHAQVLFAIQPALIGGSWISDFRRCVSAQVEQGIPPAEARQSCTDLLMTGAGVATQDVKAAEPAQLGGTWLSEFRRCVSAQVEQGIPPAEARQSCTDLLMTGAGVATQDVKATEPALIGGSWIDDFRLCVSAQVEQGIPPAEARQSCTDLLDRAE